MKTEQGRLATSVMFLIAAVVGRAATQSPPVPNLRLGNEARPLAYSAELVVVPERTNFTGQITIELVLAQRASFFWLHGHGLTVTKSYLEQQGRRIPAQPVMGGEEFLGFALQQPASAGKAKVFVSYSGSMSDKDFSGLFRRQEDGQWYAATQMEATWARRVFPCFDEPAFKVPWRLALHVKQEHTALANAPVVAETDEPGGMKCVRFAQTRPLPSYLVAVAVGPFEVVPLGKVAGKRRRFTYLRPKAEPTKRPLLPRQYLACCAALKTTTTSLIPTRNLTMWLCHSFRRRWRMRG